MKVAVGPANDPHEVEADRVADRVMRMPTPQSGPAIAPASPMSSIQRKADDGSAEEEESDATLQPKLFSGRAGAGVQRQEDDEEEEDEAASAQGSVQPKASTAQRRQPSAAFQKYVANLSGGTPLPDDARSYFEPRFGHGFGGVRIHSDGSAQRSAASIRARAYTLGPNIVFGGGEYNPNTFQGRHLLAHELTHVVQQGASAPMDVAGTSSSPTRQVAQRQPNSTEIPSTYDEERQMCIDPGICAPESAIEAAEEPIPETDLEAPIYGMGEGDFEALEQGTKVERGGVVARDEGTNLWPGTDNAVPKIGLLPLNTKLFVDRELPNGWSSVFVEKHQRGESLPVSPGAHGYVATNRITTDMPDPDAWLHRITTPGQGALDLAAEVYPDYPASCALGIAACRDHRYLVNVLVAVNEAKGRRYFYKENSGDSWDQAKVQRATTESGGRTSGGQIWVPGRSLVDALEGELSSGSISLEAIKTIGDFLIGVAGFIVGLLHGAVMSVLDVFIGAWDLIVIAKDIVVKLVKGTLVSEAKALWEDIKKIKISDILEMLSAKWNHPSTWERWHFRGYVVGYAIVELLMLYFSAGIVTAIKWAGKAGKFGKLSKYLAGLPRVRRFLDAGKELTGEGAERIRRAMRAAEALSEAHGWAARVLRIPLGILKRLTQADIAKLKRLPQWAQERFAQLKGEAMLRILGCRSPCKVDLREIDEALRLAARGGTKLQDVPDVMRMLHAIDPRIQKGKIAWVLRRNDSALMNAIRRAELTDADFAKLADYLTIGDFDNPAQAYRTFVRYVTNVVPSKVGPDIEKLNEIAEAMVAAERRRGNAMKGAMFENWVTLHVPQLASRTFTRRAFDVATLLNKRVRPFTRYADKWDPVNREIWEMKHSFGRVPRGQADDYAQLAALGPPRIVDNVNYVFPAREAAEANRHLTSNYGFVIYYIDEATNALTPLP